MSYAARNNGSGPRGHANAKQQAVSGHANAKAQAGSGRDANGRFAKGNPGGPGNPFARKVAALRKALINFVTVDDMKHVAFILKEKAMSGDLAAMKLLFQYVMGKPTETVDPDRLDIEEVKLQDERYEVVEEPAMLAEMYAGIPLSDAEAEGMDDETDEMEKPPSGNGDNGEREKRLAHITGLASKLSRMIGDNDSVREEVLRAVHEVGRAAEGKAPSSKGGNGERGRGSRRRRKGKRR